MTSYQPTVESEALDDLATKLSKDGYTLVRNPPPNTLPPFLQGTQPDAIAYGKPNLLVQLVSRRDPRQAQSKIARVQSLLSDKSDWKLHVVYIKPSSPLPTPASSSDIRKRLDQVRQLAVSDREAGLVLGWALLEASARLAAPRSAARALTPATTVEVLAEKGCITQPEADLLREVGRQRNLIVHGDFTVSVGDAAVDTVLGAVEAVLNEESSFKPTAE